MDELDALRRFRAPLAVPAAGARERVSERLAHPPRARAPRRRAALVVVLAALALALVAISGAADGVLSTIGVTRDEGSAVPATGATPVPYIAGRTYHDARGVVHDLAAVGTGFPDALVAASGEVIYTAPTENPNLPDLRLFDPATGSDTLIVASATTPAWRRDGALAYSHRTPAPGKMPDFDQMLEVRASPTAPPVTWSAGADAFQPIAWAGSTLIASTFGTDGSGVASLFVLSGPGEARELAHGALVAISPDGTRVVVASKAAPDGIPSSPDLELIELATGAVEARLDLRQVTPPALTTGQILPAGAGDWLGSRIVFPAPAGAVVLSSDNGTLTLVSVARFTGDAGLRGAEYHEARFTGTTGNDVIERAIVLPPSGKGGQMLPSALVCDLAAARCTRGSVAENIGEPLTLVYNPSRPT